MNRPQHQSPNPGQPPELLPNGGKDANGKFAKTGDRGRDMCTAPPRQSTATVGAIAGATAGSIAGAIVVRHRAAPATIKPHPRQTWRRRTAKASHQTDLRRHFAAG